MGMLEEKSSASSLLEFAASNDVKSFKLAVESSGYHSVDEIGIWYTRCIGSNMMSYQQRTPLMVAAQYGSIDVVDYILQFGNSVDVNRVAGSDQVTALHCAVAGGSHFSVSVVHRLIAASANIDAVDANGNRASDLIPMLPKLPTKTTNKQLDTLLKSGFSDTDSSSSSSLFSDCESDSKKEFAVSELPDINNGVYGNDEFRMYCFKIKPCSRAYTHDWTECPFAHPGENARRRDPKKYQYTCVPCPEFKKGSCRKGEECEFAHGVFESWLHPAQYRTRLCKDEVGCARKVCFFAHKKEELRPVYASTGSALPDVSSPSSGVATPPMSPSYAPLSPKSNGAYQGKNNNNFGVAGGTATPPSLQLPGSRLRSSFSARDVEFEKELLQMESQHFINQQHHYYYQQQQQQQQQQVLSPRPSPRWGNNNNNMMLGANLESTFASVNVARKLSPPSVLDSPRNSHSPRKLSPPQGLDSPKAMAAAMLSSRAAAAAAFAKRSHSFVDRGANLSSPMSSPVSHWGSPNGKLDWGVHGEELNKLRKSNSFGIKGANNNHATRTTSSPPGFNEPDVSWVNSLVKDNEGGVVFLGPRSPSYGARNGGQVQDMCSPWEQLYIDQEQLVVN